jgi:hypothetical protein
LTTEERDWLLRDALRARLGYLIGQIGYDDVNDAPKIVPILQEHLQNRMHPKRHPPGG